MMHPNPFNDDLQESGIPMFGKNGTALSQEERTAIAKRRGLCLKCGTKTHQVKVLGRTALTNDDVYQGICIKCNNNAVPPQILHDWQSRQTRTATVTPMGRFKGAAHAARYAAHNHARGGPPRPAGPPGGPPPGPMITADVTPVQGLTRKGSFNHTDGYARSHSHGDPGNLSRSDHRTRGAVPARATSEMAGSHHRPVHLQAVSTSQMPAAASPQHGIESEDFKTPEQDSRSLLKDMQTNREKPDILRRKLHGFRNLADDQAGALYEMKDVMDKHRSDPRFLSLAAGAVWGVCSKSDDKKQEAADTGCLDIIIDSIRNGPSKDDPDAVQWALGTMACLAHLDDNKRFIAEKSGLEAILEALKRHESKAGVFEWSCRALFSMVYDYGNEGGNDCIERNMVTIEENNGIKTIVSAIKHHTHESVAQWWALKLLFRLQDRTDTSASERGARTMCDEDLASTLAKIIKLRSTSADALILCFEMMVLLISASTGQATQNSALDSVPTAARLLGEHSSNSALQESSARFLASATRGNEQAKRQVGDGNGLRPLVGSMIEHPDHLGLLQAGFSLLWVLSSHESSFDYSLVGEAKQAVEATSGVHTDDDILNTAICGFVANVAVVAQGRPDSLPVDYVLRLAMNPVSGAAGKESSRALCALSERFPEIVNRLVESQLCDRWLTGLCDSSPEVQLSSCSALLNIATQSDAARAAILDAGGLATVSAALFTATTATVTESLYRLVSALVTLGTKKAMQLPDELILSILQAVQASPELTKLACSTIRNAMLVTVPGFKINADGLVEMLTGVIDNPSNTDDLVIEACGAIWAYASKQPLANTSMASMLFRSVLGLCSRHKGDPSPTSFNAGILVEAAGALASIMHCIRENPIHIPDNDIDLIVSVLDLVIEYDIDNAVLMERLLDVILTLCFLSKELLIQFGVIVVVIDCMVEHEANEDIQLKGSAILALLASTENLQVNLSIAETDGIDLLVSALAGFTENIEIQTSACRALSHLSIDHESRMLISSQGGLILLVNAMTKFNEDSDLLEAACSALLNLSSDAEEQVLAGSSVVETVIATMRFQLNSPRLQEKCLGVLQNVSMRSKNAKSAIATAGGIGAVAVAVKEFMGSPSVLERAFTTMWSLAVLEENQHRVADEGGISLVINGMMANITYEKVQKQACGCLCTLSSNSRNKTLIRDLGGVDAIVYAMWAHYTSDGLLVEACRALSSLAVNVQTNEVMIASEGEISAIMSAMRRFPNSERLQEHACVSLRNFLLSADNAQVVRPQAQELTQLMDAASARFPDRCAERARQVLDSLR